jgi:hypothetical protein
VIVDVEVTTAIRQAEVGAAKTMLDEKERRRKLLFDQRARPAPAEGGLTAAERRTPIVRCGDPLSPFSSLCASLRAPTPAVRTRLAVHSQQ